MGLVTNHTGLARDGVSTIVVLFSAKDLTLVALFSPEHGIRGVLDENVSTTTDEKTGLTIHSLYGDTRRPTAEMLQGVDTLVIDLQDIGARFYTCMTTMAYAMEAAAQKGIEFVVLDRPNPISAARVEGAVSDKDIKSFTTYFPMPVRHGMTLGELARMFNGEDRMGVRLNVIPMQGYRREMWFDETGMA